MAPITLLDGRHSTQVTFESLWAQPTIHILVLGLVWLLGKTFLKAFLHAGGVPDKVSDAEGGEGFSGVPGYQPADGAGAFVAPDALPQFPKVDSGGGLRGARRVGRPGTAVQCKCQQRKQQVSHARDCTTYRMEM